MHGYAMVENNARARELLACLGDASRWRLVQALKGGPRCVTELAVDVELSQSCTTRHLQALTRDGVVERRRQGKRVLFRLREEDRAIAALLAWAEGRPADAGDAADAGCQHTEPEESVPSRQTCYKAKLASP